MAVPFSIAKLERCVSTAVRNRGDTYARNGSVFFLTTPATEALLTANVTGISVYSVRVGRIGPDLFGSCTCRYYEDTAGVCKHIWAAVVAAQERGISFGAAVTGLFADEGELDGPLDGVPPEEAEAEDHDEDEDDDFVDDEDADDDDPARHFVPPEVMAQMLGRPGWIPVEQRSHWRAQISGIASSFRHRDSGAPPKGSAIIYVLNPAASGRTLALDITVRTPRKSGELGKPRPLRLQSADIQQLEDPLDREILAILDGGNRYGYGSLESSQSIGWPAADFLVPRLVATGRLWMRLAAGTIITDVTLDRDEPWQLSIRSTSRDGAYVFSGRLVRGEEELPLHETLAITRGGFVMTADGRIARCRDIGESHEWASVLKRDDVVVPAAEGEEFARMILTSAHARVFELPAELRWSMKEVAPHAIMDLRAPEQGTYVHGVVSFDYEGDVVSPFDTRRAILDEASRTSIIRDIEQEARRLETVWNSGFTRGAGDHVVIARPRLAGAIPRLLADGWDVRAPEGIYRVADELNLSLTSGIDWFDLDATAMFGSQRIRLPRLLAALRKGESFIRLDDGSLGTIPHQWRDQLEPFLATAAEEGQEGIRFRNNQVLLLDALLAMRPQVEFDELFDQTRRKILDAAPLPLEPPQTFHGELRPYQKDGLGWFTFLRELSFGGCLADDMGLGKTVQVLALLEQRRHEKEGAPRPSIVVVPRSLVFNWKEEAARFAPDLRILDHTAPGRARDAAAFADVDVVLTTYALLRRDVEVFASAEFDYAILDEAQAIKNASSLSAKAALLLRARHRLALSGTPIENHLGELGSLFEFLNPGMLRGNSGRMSALLRDAGKKGDEAAASRALIARAVRPFILRRTKAQVASELPERVEQTVYCELGSKQRKLYDELLEFYRASLLGRVAEQGLNRSKMHVLEALLRLRQAACHPGLVDPERAGEESAKLETLMDELTILIDERHKVLVFSQFTSFLSIVRKQLDDRGIEYAYLDGHTRDRAEQVTRFQNDPELPLFLISLKAGGLGLNLTAAEYVFLLDPWWNPAVEAQAIDRAHRIGQSRNVFAYRLVARDTIEEKILLLQQNKRALADAIVSAENSLLRQLTTEDLELLLS